MNTLKILALPALLSALTLSAGYAVAADQVLAQEKSQSTQQQQNDGNRFMTAEERAEQRAKISAAKTDEEREQIRVEQHKRMKDRANNERGMRASGSGHGAMPTFADFDLNGDGKISEDEFIEARTARISARAQQGHQMQGLANAPSFADIDTNSDGAISPEEFSAQQSLQRQKMGR